MATLGAWRPGQQRPPAGHSQLAAPSAANQPRPIPPEHLQASSSSQTISDQVMMVSVQSLIAGDSGAASQLSSGHHGAAAGLGQQQQQQQQQSDSLASQFQPQESFNSTTYSTLVGTALGANTSNGQLLLLFALLVFINLIVILGNILVIVAVYATAKLRNVTNIFIVSLATADLLLGILVLPYALLYEVLDVWVFGQIWCRGWLVTDVWISTASILNLCAISIDRYVAVTRPVKYRSIMTTRRAKCIVAAVWVLSFTICFPPLLPRSDWSAFSNGISLRDKHQLDAVQPLGSPTVRLHQRTQPKHQPGAQASPGEPLIDADGLAPDRPLGGRLTKRRALIGASFGGQERTWARPAMALGATSSGNLNNWSPLPSGPKWGPKQRQHQEATPSMQGRRRHQPSDNNAANQRGKGNRPARDAINGTQGARCERFIIVIELATFAATAAGARTRQGAPGTSGPSCAFDCGRSGCNCNLDLQRPPLGDPMSLAKSPRRANQGAGSATRCISLEGVGPELATVAANCCRRREARVAAGSAGAPKSLSGSGRATGLASPGPGPGGGGGGGGAKWFQVGQRETMRTEPLGPPTGAHQGPPLGAQHQVGPAAKGSARPAARGAERPLGAPREQSSYRRRYATAGAHETGGPLAGLLLKRPASPSRSLGERGPTMMTMMMIMMIPIGSSARVAAEPGSRAASRPARLIFANNETIQGPNGWPSDGFGCEPLAWSERLEAGGSSSNNNKQSDISILAPLGGGAQQTTATGPMLVAHLGLAIGCDPDEACQRCALKMDEILSKFPEQQTSDNKRDKNKRKTAPRATNPQPAGDRLNASDPRRRRLVAPLVRSAGFMRSGSGRKHPGSETGARLADWLACTGALAMVCSGNSPAARRAGSALCERLGAVCKHSALDCGLANIDGHGGGIVVSSRRGADSSGRLSLLGSGQDNERPDLLAAGQGCELIICEPFQELAGRYCCLRASALGGLGRSFKVASESQMKQPMAAQQPPARPDKSGQSRRKRSQPASEAEDAKLARANLEQAQLQQHDGASLRGNHRPRQQQQRQPELQKKRQECSLFHEKTYVIYSAFGSFYIPMLIMVFFYSRIYLVASRAQKAMQRGYMTTKSWPSRQLGGASRAPSWRQPAGAAAGQPGPSGRAGGVAASARSQAAAAAAAAAGLAGASGVQRVTLRIHRRAASSQQQQQPAGGGLAPVASANINCCGNRTQSGASSGTTRPAIASNNNHSEASTSSLLFALNSNPRQSLQKLDTAEAADLAPSDESNEMSALLQLTAAEWSKCVANAKRTRFSLDNSHMALKLDHLGRQRELGDKRPLGAGPSFSHSGRTGSLDMFAQLNERPVSKARSILKEFWATRARTTGSGSGELAAQQQQQQQPQQQQPALQQTTCSGEEQAREDTLAGPQRHEDLFLPLASEVGPDGASQGDGLELPAASHARSLVQGEPSRLNETNIVASSAPTASHLRNRPHNNNDNNHRHHHHHHHHHHHAHAHAHHAHSQHHNNGIHHHHHHHHNHHYHHHKQHHQHHQYHQHRSQKHDSFAAVGEPDPDKLAKSGPLHYHNSHLHDLHLDSARRKLKQTNYNAQATDDNAVGSLGALASDLPTAMISPSGKDMGADQSQTGDLGVAEGTRGGTNSIRIVINSSSSTNSSLHSQPANVVPAIPIVCVGVHLSNDFGEPGQEESFALLQRSERDQADESASGLDNHGPQADLGSTREPPIALPKILVNWDPVNQADCQLVASENVELDHDSRADRPGGASSSSWPAVPPPPPPATPIELPLDEPENYGPAATSISSGAGSGGGLMANLRPSQVRKSSMMLLNSLTVRSGQTLRRLSAAAAHPVDALLRGGRGRTANSSACSSSCTSDVERGLDHEGACRRHRNRDKRCARRRERSSSERRREASRKLKSKLQLANGQPVEPSEGQAGGSSEANLEHQRVKKRRPRRRPRRKAPKKTFDDYLMAVAGIDTPSSSSGQSISSSASYRTSVSSASSRSMSYDDEAGGRRRLADDHQSVGSESDDSARPRHGSGLSTIRRRGGPGRRSSSSSEFSTSSSRGTSSGSSSVMGLSTMLTRENLLMPRIASVATAATSAAHQVDQNSNEKLIGRRFSQLRNAPATMATEPAASPTFPATMDGKLSKSGHANNANQTASLPAEPRVDQMDLGLKQVVANGNDVQLVASMPADRVGCNEQAAANCRIQPDDESATLMGGSKAASMANETKETMGLQRQGALYESATSARLAGGAVPKIGGSGGPLPIATTLLLAGDSNTVATSKLCDQDKKHLGDEAMESQLIEPLTATSLAASANYQASEQRQQAPGAARQRRAGASATSGGPAKRTSRWHAKRLRAETKAAKTVAIIVGGFIFCWLPFFTAYFTRAVICDSPNCIPQTWLSLFIWLGYLNSAINPVIYGLFSADFRHAFKNIVCRCRWRDHHRHHHHHHHHHHHNSHHRRLNQNDDTKVVSVLVDSIIKSIL